MLAAAGGENFTAALARKHRECVQPRHVGPFPYVKGHLLGSMSKPRPAWRGDQQRTKPIKRLIGRGWPTLPGSLCYDLALRGSLQRTSWPCFLLPYSRLRLGYSASAARLLVSLFDCCGDEDYALTTRRTTAFQHSYFDRLIAPSSRQHPANKYICIRTTTSIRPSN